MQHFEELVSGQGPQPHMWQGQNVKLRRRMGCCGMHSQLLYTLSVEKSITSLAAVFVGHYVSDIAA